MVGRSVRLTVDKQPATPGKPILEVSGLVVDDDRRVRAVDGVDLTVHAGEVLGIAGVQGNGQTELIEAIMGLRPALAGTVTLDGEAVHGWPTKKVLRAGVGYVPEDRSVDGLVKEFSVAGEPGAGHLRPATLRQGPVAQAGRHREVGEGTDRAVRRPYLLGGHTGGHALRR